MEEIIKRIDDRLCRMEKNQDILFSKVDGVQNLLNETSMHIMRTNEFLRDLSKQTNHNTLCIKRIENDLEHTTMNVNWLMGKNEDLLPKIDGTEEIKYDEKSNNGG